jgi:transposase
LKQNPLERPEAEVYWAEMEKGYKVSSFKSAYGEIEQRWLLVYSAQAFERERKTLEKNLDKKAQMLEKLPSPFTLAGQTLEKTRIFLLKSQVIGFCCKGHLCISVF